MTVLIVGTIKFWLWDNSQRNRTQDKRNQFKGSVELTLNWIQWCQRTSKEKTSYNPTTLEKENA